MAKAKYGNRKVVREGITFDSLKEYRRFCELSLLEKAGQITNLQRQVKYVLIPQQREFTNEIYERGKKKGCFKPGRILERECSYIADFQYIENGKTVVEDVKGMRTKEYIIKRKLMLYRHGIKIKEV